MEKQLTINGKKNSIKQLVLSAVLVGLAIGLINFKIFSMPLGGSVDLADIPLILIALLVDFNFSITALILFSIINFIREPIFLHPFQFLLDYSTPILFIIIKKAKEKKQIYFLLSLAYLLKFLFHYISGVVFFAKYTPAGQSKYVYSFLYNLSYTFPRYIISLIFIKFFPIEKFKQK